MINPLASAIRTPRAFARAASAFLLLTGLPLLAACSSEKGAITDGTVFPETDESYADAMRLKREADDLFKEGKVVESSERYKDAIKRRPNYGEAWNNLGLAFMRDNNRYDAQQAFVRAGELMPLDPTPMDNLGVLYMESNLPDDALRYFEMALERRPTYLPAIRGAVRAAQLTGKSREEDLERIKAGLRMESDPTWRTMFQRQLARVQADLDDQNRNSSGFQSTRRRNGAERSDVEAQPPVHAEAGVVLPRAEE